MGLKEFGRRNKNSDATLVDYLALRDAIKNHTALIKEWTKEEADVPWAQENTPLSTDKGDGWTYNAVFQPLFSAKEGNLKNYIEQEFSGMSGDVRIVDLCSMGSAVRDDFTEGFIDKSAGVSLADVRGRIDDELFAKDEARNHFVIPGDIFSLKSQHDVSQTMSDIHVLLSRFMNGDATFPNYPPMLGSRISGWYELLHPERGLIVSEVPRGLTNYVAEWEKMIQRDYQDVLKVKTAGDDINRLIRIDKFPGAPEKLPLLSKF